MLALAKDHLDQGLAVGPGRLGLAQDTLVCPVCIAPMPARHVLGDGGVAVRPSLPAMQADALALVEDLDGVRRDADLHPLAQQTLGHGVEVLLDFDVVVDADARDVPLSVFVGCVRQSAKRRLVEPLEQLAPALADVPHDPAVEVLEQLGDRLVELGEGEEFSVPQPCQDPALDHLDGNLDFRFVARLPDPGRHDGGPLVVESHEVVHLES